MDETKRTPCKDKGEKKRQKKGGEVGARAQTFERVIRERPFGSEIDRERQRGSDQSLIGRRI